MNPINFDLKTEFPQRIVCMTEESVETLFLLGKGHLIVGVSGYVKRPKEAKKIPKISAFTHANISKIKKLQPDLILGFSDIQKEIAKNLIAEGMNVFIANHRDISGILNYILLLGQMVGAKEEAQDLQKKIISHLEQIQVQAKKLPFHPKVYFEEWDNPMIAGIRWVSDLIELCGGKDIAREVSQGVLAKDRFVDSQVIIGKNPDIILGCWCGKKVEIESYAKRPGWQVIEAVKNQRVFEVVPEIFLQPGPAPLLDGATILLNHFSNFGKTSNLTAIN